MPFVLSPWQAFGNLDNRGNSGFACANLNNALGTANWNIGARAYGIIKFIYYAVHLVLSTQAVTPASANCRKLRLNRHRENGSAVYGCRGGLVDKPKALELNHTNFKEG